MPRQGAARGTRHRDMKNKWVILLIVLTVAWLGLMIWASHWGYMQRDPVRIEQPR